MLLEVKNLNVALDGEKVIKNLLLLDEPTASLDPSIAEEIRGKIKGYVKKESVAVLWTSHNMKEIEIVCDRVLFLSHGRILLFGDPKLLPVQHGKTDLEELFIAVAREPLTFKEN
jgi:ABC-2 type transport system ATP-binding protein